MSDLRHGEGCGCQRCRGFEPGNGAGIATRFEDGNSLRLLHGAYSTVALGARVDELADEIRPFVRAYQPEDELAVKALALTIARIEAAAGALAVAEPGDFARLEQDMRGWTNMKLKLLAELGLTPLARRRLGMAVGGSGGPAQPDVTELPDDGEGAS